MASAADFLADMNDSRLKPRLLRSLLRDRLPLAQAEDAVPPPAELASVLEAVRARGLLTERLPDPPDPRLAEAWRAAMDAWVERLLALASSERAHSCWLGTCFLGLTFQECSDERFAESYSHWFEKVLKNLQVPSSTQIINMVACTSMADLLVRLAKFSNLKKEAMSFAAKVVQPVLLLLNGNGPVADKAVDLLGILIKFYPSSLNRYYNKVESAIASKVMSTDFSLQQSKKFAGSLALLPCIKVAEDGWSLMIQRILVVVNNLLNDAFLGLEEEKKGTEIMMFLVPPGKDPPPPLEGHTRSGGHVHATKKFRVSTVPTISALIHCCCEMLTSSYPVQVNVPVRNLIALIRRVLLVDGSLRRTFPSTTSLHQELICFELPSLHSSFLDLLSATIKGIQRQLLPHAANVIRLITEYFRRAKLPTIRIKVYGIVQLLLTSMGVGMSLHLLQVVVSNAFADLDDGCETNLFSLNTNPSKAINESSSKSYSKKRKQILQLQNPTVFGSEKAAIGPKRQKSSSVTQASNGITTEPTTVWRKLTPLPVKVAALQTLEILLNVGGSLRADNWRTEVDLLLVNVARNACDMGGGYERRSSTPEEPSISDFQLASLKALLASFLSPFHSRPPYLAQGLELFNRGKLETGTKLAEFCSHALLALDVLMHPRALPLESAAPGGSGLNYGVPENSIFGTGKSKLSISGGNNRAMDDLEDEEMYSNWLASSDDDVPADVLIKDSAAGKDPPVELSKRPEVQQRNDQKLLHEDTMLEEHREINSSRIPEAGQEAPKFSETDVRMAAAGPEENHGLEKIALELNKLDNPSSVGVVSTLTGTASPDPLKLGVASVSDKHSDIGRDVENKRLAVGMSSAKAASLHEGLIFSGGASGSQKALENSSRSFALPSMPKFDSDSESVDSMPDIVDADPDSD